MTSKTNKRIIINRLYKDSANPEQKSKYFIMNKKSSTQVSNLYGDDFVHQKSLPTSSGDSGDKRSSISYLKLTFEQQFFNNFDKKVTVTYEPVKKDSGQKTCLKRNLYQELKALQKDTLITNKQKEMHSQEQMSPLRRSGNNSNRNVSARNIEQKWVNKTKDQQHPNQGRSYYFRKITMEKKQPLTLNQRQSTKYTHSTTVLNKDVQGQNQEDGNIVQAKKQNSSITLPIINIQSPAYFEERQNQYKFYPRNKYSQPSTNSNKENILPNMSNPIKNPRKSRSGFIRHRNLSLQNQPSKQNSVIFHNQSQMDRKIQKSQQRLKSIRQQLHQIYNMRNQQQKYHERVSDSHSTISQYYFGNPGKSGPGKGTNNIKSFREKIQFSRSRLTVKTDAF